MVPVLLRPGHRPPVCPVVLSAVITRFGLPRCRAIEPETAHPRVSLKAAFVLCSTLQIYLRFLDYQMEHSNECKRNFVAVYDGSSSIENLKAKFCSTVANDVTLKTGVGVIRMWADEGSRLSRFRMLFTSFVERKQTLLPRPGLARGAPAGYDR